MKTKSGLKIKGKIRLDIIDFKTGKEWSVEGPNTITVAGDAWVADRLSDAGDTAPSGLYAAAGTTSGGKTTASNALEGQISNRVLASSVTQGTGGDDNDVVWVFVFGAGISTGDWQEIGMFNAASSGNMHCYAENPTIDINKTASMQITINWTWTIGAS